MSRLKSYIRLIVVLLFLLTACQPQPPTTSSTSTLYPIKEPTHSFMSFFNVENLKRLPIPLAAPFFPKDSPAALHGRLQVQGTLLVDQSGTPYQLRGVSTHGIQWYGQYINEDCFQTLRDEWQANVIRLAMYTDDNSSYPERKEQLESLMEEGICLASKLGLYVIVDWHILSDGNPNAHIEDSLRFFNYFSTKYQNYTNVIFEICNEPNGSNVTWEEEIKPYATQLVATIRKNAKDALIIVGTPRWCQNLLSVVKSRLDDPNVMYALHFYAATHTTVLRETLENAVNKHKLPVFVTEFGTCDASGSGPINIEQSDKWLDLLDNLQISWINWSLCDKAETSALLSPSSSAEGYWEDSQLTPSGRYIKERLLADAD